MKPKLLDLFCCAGGAAVGYSRAGFDVYGIDNKPQKHYPFPILIIDALEAMDRLLRGEGLTFSNGETLYLKDFAAFHASPPCQDYSLSIKHLTGKNTYPRLIADMELRFRGKLWVIENVPGAPIPYGQNLFGECGLMLCGTMLGLTQIRRHRLFLSSILIPRPYRDCEHRYKTVLNPYNTNSRKRDHIQHNALTHYAKTMGIDWMKGDEIGEAIPPAYTEYIGKYLMEAIKQQVIL